MPRAKIFSIFIFIFILSVSVSGLCEDISLVEKSFEKFNRSWMKKLQRIERENFRNIKAEDSGDLYRAEYIGYSREFDFSVKRTKSSLTPFIGILTYNEIKYVSIGRDKKGALKGPFFINTRIKVKEIFRYTKGEWVY